MLMAVIETTKPNVPYATRAQCKEMGRCVGEVDVARICANVLRFATERSASQSRESIRAPAFAANAVVHEE